MFIRVNIKLQERYTALVPLDPQGSVKEEKYQSPTTSLLCSATQLPLPLPAQITCLHTCALLPARAACMKPEHWHETVQDSQSLSLDYRLQTINFQRLRSTALLHGRIFKGNIVPWVRESWERTSQALDKWDSSTCPDFDWILLYHGRAEQDFISDSCVPRFSISVFFFSFPFLLQFQTSLRYKWYDLWWVWKILFAQKTLYLLAYMHKLVTLFQGYNNFQWTVSF